MHTRAVSVARSATASKVAAPAQILISRGFASPAVLVKLAESVTLGEDSKDARSRSAALLHHLWLASTVPARAQVCTYIVPFLSSFCRRTRGYKLL
jgi:hypothetical protein